MTKVYYSLMRNPVIALPCLVVCALALAGLVLGGQTPQASLKAASLESHEGLTVSALPWTDPAQYKEKFPKKSPFAGGVLAVEVSFRNDSDESVRVNLERIRLTVQLGDDNRQEVPSLNSEELADAVLKPKGKDPTASRGPKLPIPVVAVQRVVATSIGRSYKQKLRMRACRPVLWRRTAPCRACSTLICKTSLICYRTHISTCHSLCRCRAVAP